MARGGSPSTGNGRPKRRPPDRCVRAEKTSGRSLPRARGNEGLVRTGNPEQSLAKGAAPAAPPPRAPRRRERPENLASANVTEHPISCQTGETHRVVRGREQGLLGRALAAGAAGVPSSSA